jgi:hypothetical protein
VGIAFEKNVWNKSGAMNDTTIQAAQAQIRALQAMSPSKRLSMALGWSQSVREMSRQGLRRQFPNRTESELQHLYAERLLGAELAEKVYGPLNHHG